MDNNVITFDGQDFFIDGRHVVLPLSWRRDTVDKGFAGLDGVLSVDLGLRERKIKQTGRLTAKSVESLIALTQEIMDYIDGQGYTLVGHNNVSYENVRMDSFTPGEITVGNQACCEYEINYTQLSE